MKFREVTVPSGHKDVRLSFPTNTKNEFLPLALAKGLNLNAEITIPSPHADGTALFA